MKNAKNAKNSIDVKFFQTTSKEFQPYSFKQLTTAISNKPPTIRFLVAITFDKSGC